MFIPGILGRAGSKYRNRIAKKTDDRIKHMSEMINGMQVIKMYAWEKPFEKIIRTLRKKEIKEIKKSLIVKALFLCLIVIADRVSLFVVVICFTLLGNFVTSDIIFALAQLFNLLLVSMSFGFPNAINAWSEIVLIIERCEEYLNLEEKNTKSSKNTGDESKNIYFQRVSAAWDEKQKGLVDINMKIPDGNLCVIIGPVGCGKSTLLHVILGELSTSKGVVKASGKISYASQEPWLFVGTVRDNILFDNPYVKERYDEVVNVCALERDFQQFPNGDKTIVGERGVLLSGGQRARINLARAVYREADIYLFDDPLSAVDTHVSKHIFRECVIKYLANKTRILVTHQLQVLNRADQIVVMSNVCLFFKVFFIFRIILC